MSTPFQPAASIDEVIDRLNVVMDTSIQESTALGIFPALYVVVTQKIKEGIDRGDVFEDGPRMEKLDVIFANRFLEAYHQYRNGERPTDAWHLAFKTVKRFSRHVILQELLISTNAHINLDLGISAALTAPGDAIHGLKNDFYAINAILSSLIDGVKQDLVDLSPRFGVLLRFFKGKEDAMLDFSIRKARDAAWDFAQKLARADDQKDERLIRRRDDETSMIGRLVVTPGWLGMLILWWVKWRETKDIGWIVSELRNNFEARARFPGEAD